MANQDKLIGGLARSEKLRFYKPSIANATAGQIHSLWRSNGFPTLGAIPAVAETCIAGMVGSWPLPTPGIGEKRYLAKLSASNSVACQVMVFDRLAHMGGLVGNIATLQNVNLSIAAAAAQDRCGVNGEGVLWGLEWYADTGSTAVTATITYTNQDDVANRTTSLYLLATRRSSTFLPILPNVDDLRIKSIQSVQLSATTGTAGNFGVTARKRVAELPLPIVGVGAIADYASLALPDLVGDECLELLVVAGVTSTGNLLGSMEVITAAFD